MGYQAFAPNMTLMNSSASGKHPRGLYILFATEMWERFSFYGMKALLIFYLTKYHLFIDAAGNLLVGSYAALGYAMPVLGGYLADKYLGFRKAVTFGAILLVIGHLGMAFEGNAATNINGTVQRDETALQVFYFSLSLIVMGVGFLKANISSIVGELYEKHDARKDSAFTIFYMGINLGSFLASIICVWLGETYGWSYGFGAAGVGMLLGLVVFIGGKKYLMGKGEPPNPELLRKPVWGIASREIFIYTASVLGTLVVWQMIQRHSLVEALLLIAGIASLIYIVWYAIKLDAIARDRLIALTILIISSVIFWSLFEQAYTSLNLFADRVVDRNVFGIELKAGQVLSLNSLFIIGFAPLFAWMWIKLTRYNLNPTAAVKFSFALILAGLGFGALVLGDQFADGGKVALGWLVITYLLHTFGELCLSPVGLSSVTKLSPAKIVGFMMGVWFLATAGSEYISALLANLASIDHSGEKGADLIKAKKSYNYLFTIMFYTGVAAGLALLALSPKIKKMMHGVK